MIDSRDFLQQELSALNADDVCESLYYLVQEGVSGETYLNHFSNKLEIMVKHPVFSCQMYLNELSKAILKNNATLVSTLVEILFEKLTLKME